MDRIEFLNRTDNRHLRTHIRLKIRDAFGQREDDLERRRASLQEMLSFEDLQQEEEMANLFRTRILENMQKRLDWIASAKFERSEAEREFLKLKQIQRELINCEEMRPKESRKITEDTKRVQLIQIAERKGLEMKEKEIDKIWFDASMCLEREKEKQQQYETQLRKMIARDTVNVLDSQLEHRKFIKEMENEEKKADDLMIEQARHEDALRIDFEERHKLDQKLKEGARQRNELQALHSEKQMREKQIQFSEAKANENLNIQMKQETEALKIKKDLEKESFDRYMQYVEDKKSEMNCRNKMLDTALVTYGRRMQAQPVNKVPYQKSVR